MKDKICLDPKLCQNTTLETLFNPTHFDFFTIKNNNYILKNSYFKSFRKHKYPKKNRGLI